MPYSVGVLSGYGDQPDRTSGINFLRRLFGAAFLFALNVSRGRLTRDGAPGGVTGGPVTGNSSVGMQRGFAWLGATRVRRNGGFAHNRRVV